MIYINLFDNPPPQELIDEGAELTRQLIELPPDDRNDFINRHSKYWGKLKEHYTNLSCGKCWYTEAKDIASNYHMDHFRPKKQPKELRRNCTIETTTSAEAYWWLAFDWKNYRLAASKPNTSKGSYFPLRYGTNAITRGDNPNQEHIGLLDPTNKNDVSLIAFGIDGKVCPACEDLNCWEATRVRLSIRVYNLDCISLVDARKEVQQSCKVTIEMLKNAYRNYCNTYSETDEAQVNKYIQELRKMTHPSTQLSAVARNYIRNYVEEFRRNTVG